MEETKGKKSEYITILFPDSTHSRICMSLALTPKQGWRNGNEVHEEFDTT